MLSAVRGFIVPVVIVVATAHTALSVTQYHRIQRLDDELGSLRKDTMLLSDSHDLCITQSEAKDNEIVALKGMVELFVEKGGGLNIKYNEEGGHGG